MKNLSEHQDFLLKRASQNEIYMAYTLTSFATKSGLAIEELRHELDCTSDSLLKLALCRRVSFGNPDFAQSVQEIADFTGIDAVKLAFLLKRISSPFLQVHKGAAPAPHSFVAAARERDRSIDSTQQQDAE